MTAPDPLQECLLGLHATLGECGPLIVAGGYGLYLKQRSILQMGLRTLLRPELLPDNRTTNDIDLFLRAEVVVNAKRMKLVRDALDGLGFTAVPGSEYLQFAKRVEPAGSIKIDLLVGPLGGLFDANSVKRDERRVRPKAFAGLHAHPLDEAVAVEARRVVGQHFAAPDSLGILRLREHPLSFARMDLDTFRDELSAILPPSTI